MKKHLLLIGASTLFFLSGCTIQVTTPEEWEQFFPSGDYEVIVKPIEKEENIPEELPPIEEEPELPPIEENEPPIEEDKKQTYTYLKCKADNLNIRSGAGTGFASIGFATKGDHLPLYGKSGNWYETRYLGKKAFVYSSYMELVSFEVTPSDYEKAIEKAYDCLGTKYVYGAVRYHDGKGNLLSSFNPKEFDCSSLVQYVYYIGEGIVLDVNTRTQVYQGEKVETAQRGDLLYMTNDTRRYKTGIERIGHVGIYLGGNLLLHTSSDYAKIVEMTDQRWKDVISINRM